MKVRTYIFIAIIQTVVLTHSHEAKSAELWQVPFDTTSQKPGSVDSLLSLDEVFRLVAAENPAFRSFSYRIFIFPDINPTGPPLIVNEPFVGAGRAWLGFFSKYFPT